MGVSQKVINIINRISHILKWLPVLWKDYDFDYQFLLNIIEFKLYCIQKHLEDWDITVSSKRNAKDIRIVIEHLKRYRDIENYVDTPKHTTDCMDSRLNCGYRYKSPDNKVLKYFRGRDDLRVWHLNRAFDIIRCKIYSWWD